jgi:hypothetical protein
MGTSRSKLVGCFSKKFYSHWSGTNAIEVKLYDHANRFLLEKRPKVQIAFPGDLSGLILWMKGQVYLGFNRRPTAF